MKRYLSLVFVLLILFSINVGALTLDKYNFGIMLDEDYVVLTEDNLSGNDELISALGHSSASIEQYFKDNSMILYAVSTDVKRQLQVTCRQTEFSTRMEDISLLNDDDVLGLVNHFVKVTKAADLTLVTTDGLKLYEVISLDEDSGGSFCTIQYITVKGGKLYTLSFFESAEKVNSDFKAFAFDTISTLSIKSDTKATFTGAENITEMVIVGILLIIAAALAISLIISLVCDFIRRDDSERTFVIRRRRK